MTGGGNGIGREICLELARCGCNVACLDLDYDAAQQLCLELRQLGVQAIAYKVTVDLSSKELHFEAFSHLFLVVRLM